MTNERLEEIREAITWEPWQENVTRPMAEELLAEVDRLRALIEAATDELDRQYRENRECAG